MKVGDLVVINSDSKTSPGQCGVVLQTEIIITPLPMDGPTQQHDVATVLIDGHQKVFSFEQLSIDQTNGGFHDC
jgi:hypothetical protein|tara:strand:+ start:1790 stop:2011 length:222 start_codon:yes stop_codon:yes gene_type:complete